MPETHAIEPEVLMAYLDGELSADRATEAMTHLERCAECQKLAADMRSISREMAAWQVESPKEMAAPVGPAPVAKRGFPFRWPLSAKVGAACMASVGAIAIITTATRPRSHSVLFVDGISQSDNALISPTPSSVSERLIPREMPAGRVEPSTNFSYAPPLPPRAIVPPALAAPQKTVIPTLRAEGFNEPSQDVKIACAPSSPGSASQCVVVAAGPMIERNVTLNLTVRDYDPVRARVEAILGRHHGYIGEMTSSAPTDAGRSLNATLRIHAAELDAALAELRQIGRVSGESQKGEDVTRAYADLNARLSNAQATEQRLTQLLAQRTGKLSDVLEVEQQISRVRGEIEQMEAERRTTNELVAFASVQLSISEDYKQQLALAPESTGSRLRNAAVEGYKNLAGGVVGAALVAITYGPSLLLWGILALLVGRWVVRRRKRAMS